MSARAFRERGSLAADLPGNGGDGSLNQRVVKQMPVVATCQYARSLDPLPVDVRTRGMSQSTVSLRFVAKTAAQTTASLESLDLVAPLIDGMHVGEHGLVVALGDITGQKHPLGLWDGSTENATVSPGVYGICRIADRRRASRSW